MESSPLISVGLPISLFIIMVGIGLTLTLLESSEMSIPAVVYSVMMHVFGAILIMMGRRLVPLTR